MNTNITDDPKLTAYALGELGPRERAAVEKRLAGDAGARRYVEELRAFTAQLAPALRAEAAPELGPAERQAIREAARRRRKVVAFPAWLPRFAVPLAAAATVVVGASLVLLPALHHDTKALKKMAAANAKRAAGEVYVGIDFVTGPPGQQPSVAAPPPPALASASGAAGQERMVELKLELPKPQFQGTPCPIKLPNLEPIDPERSPAPVSTFGKTLDAVGPRQAPMQGQPGPAVLAEAQPQGYGAPRSSWGEAPSQQVVGKRMAGAFLVEVLPAPEPPQIPLLLQPRPHDTETYDRIEDNPFLDAKQNPLSTFSIDVDTGSYANVRRFLRGGELPPAGAVRIEELLNYFEYDYPPAPEGRPFSVSVDVVEAPWNAKYRLARIGLKGREIDPAGRPPCNLVFLLDVSGSMGEPNKLPLVQQAMKILLEQLGEKDRVAIVTYAGTSGLALPSTQADRKRDIREAIDALRSGGSTNGGAGIQLAYDIAKANLIAGGVNRVILATDGDFNVGATSRDELLRLVEDRAKSGVFLTVLGFGMGNLKDATLEQLADKGNGTYGYIDDEREAKRLFARHATGSLVTIAKDVKIQIEFNPAQVGAYRLIGYENRALRAEDFNDDTKDAGEIGSGHTVTALYELIPPGEATALPRVDDLKYQQAPKAAAAAKSDEMMTVKLRYKKPDADASDKIEVPVRDAGGGIAAAGPDLKFAAAVAEFGMLLRHSPHKGAADWKSVLELAAAGRGADSHGDRAEFIDLVRAAEKLSDQR